MTSKLAPKKTLSTFIWSGVNQKNEQVNGEIEADTQAMVKAMMRQKGIIVRRVHKKNASILSRILGRIRPKHICAFSRQLATLLKAGIPLIQAFGIIARSSELATLEKLIISIRTEVETGVSLSDALKHHPEHFDDLFCNLVHVGEQSGTLDTILARVAEHKERMESIKGKIKKALFYPITVIVVASLVTAVLLLFVIPQFATLFKSFGASLPLPTQMVIQFSQLTEKYWFFGVGAVIAGIWLFIRAHKKSKHFAYRVDLISLKLPVLGKILSTAALARFTKTFALSFAAGLPITDALQAVAGATGNRVFEKAILKIKDNISTGQRLQSALREHDVFPSMAVQMIGVGEEAGELEKMLNRLGDSYQEETDHRIDGLSSLIEPILMTVLGVVIGGLVIAMYLPIFKLGSIL